MEKFDKKDDTMLRCEDGNVTLPKLVVGRNRAFAHDDQHSPNDTVANNQAGTHGGDTVVGVEIFKVETFFF